MDLLILVLDAAWDKPDLPGRLLHCLQAAFPVIFHFLAILRTFPMNTQLACAMQHNLICDDSG